MKNRIFSISLAFTLALSVGLVGCTAEVPETTEYTLTISSAEGGQVTSPGQGIHTYDEGTKVNVVAVADEGYQFAGWTGNVSTVADVEDATTTIIMSGDYSITANFAVKQYTLVIHSTEGGSVTTPGEDAYTYDKGDMVSLVAEADEGYVFVDWTGDVSTIGDVSAASTNITMNGGYSITANFAGTIRDWYDLDAIKDDLGGNYVLMNDLDSAAAGYGEFASQTANAGKGWEPIGTSLVQFFGSLDGQGHEVRDLFSYRPAELYVGLFGAVAWEGLIVDVGLVDTELTGRYEVGALVGSNGGTISNCHSTGSVTGAGDWAVGGLVGRNDGSVSDSYCTASVHGVNDVGGLVGGNGGSISDSYFSGSLTGNWRLGGLVGLNWGMVSNSHYDYNEVLINGERAITIGALFTEDFEEWLANGMFLDVNERLSREDDYYVINDVVDFRQLLAFGQDVSLKFRLRNDLDLDTEPNLFIPYFAGEFDGNGCKITNLTLDFDSVSDVGLFGYLASSGKVSEVGVEDARIAGGQLVGCLAGGNRGTIENSYCTGNVTGRELVGGLVGKNEYGSLRNSHSCGIVTGDVMIGGLAGQNYFGIIDNSYSTCSTTGTGGVGGLVGENQGRVNNSYAMGSVAGSEAVGGLLGWNYGTVTDCYSVGGVTGYHYVGGLAGRSYRGTVSNSFWNSQMSGQSTSDGGTGKTTTEMKTIATFSGAGWNIIAVANPNTRNPSYIWNIVDGQTYPFLSWEA